jgi:hypothetical protein
MTDSLTETWPGWYVKQLKRGDTNSVEAFRCIVQRGDAHMVEEVRRAIQDVGFTGEERAALVALLLQ